MIFSCFLTLLLNFHPIPMAFAQNSNKVFLGEYLAGFGIALPLSSETEITKFKSIKGEVLRIETGEAHLKALPISRKNIDLHLQINVTYPLKAEEAKRQINTNLLAVKRLYEGQATPYKGEITRANQGCDKQVSELLTQKTKFENQEIHYLVGSTSGKGQFGSCEMVVGAKGFGVVFFLFMPKKSALVQFRGYSSKLEEVGEAKKTFLAFLEKIELQ